MHGYVVAERLEGVPRECIINTLRFLETGDVGLPLGEPSERIVDALLDGIDVPRCDSHGCLRAWHRLRGLQNAPIWRSSKCQRHANPPARFELNETLK